MGIRERLLAAVALALIPALPGLARSQYSFTTIDAPGAYRTAVNGLSPTALVGEFQLEKDGEAHGFILKNGAFTAIGVPGATDTSVCGINTRGQICGTFAGLDGFRRGFLRNTDGTFTTIHSPGSVHTFVNGMNLRGDLVGTTQDTAGARHGFVWSKGTFTTLDAPSAQGLTIGGGTVALGMNDLQKVVGNYTTFRGEMDLDHHGFIASRGIYTKVDVPGANSTTLAGISSDGAAVGSYFDRQGRRGFVVINNVVTLVDVEGPGSQTGVVAIDAHGDSSGHYRIAGYFTDAEGAVRGFLGTPAGK